MAQAPLLPPLPLLLAATSIAAAAALANCALLATTLKRWKTGLYNIITQLAIVDCVLLVTTVGPELWTSNSGAWSFGEWSCVAHRGLRVLATTVSVYLVATLALHSLAELNLEEKASHKRNKRIGRDEDDEIRSSRHSLVANSDSSTPPRTMNIDYRMPKSRVSIILPTIFIWILSASLSIPEFTLGTIVTENDTLQCSIVDFSHRFNMETMLTVFTLLLPTSMLIIVGLIILWKIKSVNCMDVESESIASLKLSVWLTAVFCVLCVPRSVMDVYIDIDRSHLSMEDENNKVVDYTHVKILNLAFNFLFLISILLRPLLSLSLLDPLRKMLSCHSNVNV